MAAGYAFGTILQLPDRRKWTPALGLSMTVLLRRHKDGAWLSYL
jgi:hypothetical protein